MLLKKFLLASGAFLLVGAAHVSTAVSAPDCPPPRHYQGACIQVIVWAKNPDSGTCCQYSTPCAAPAGWTTYTSAEACATG
ncbi:MAG TPA: hypothetical protein VKM72_31010 [Thermoanaerobaculia bacterium]|nr:hypothetical protein [Thermoanaerobaculia bacterium]